MYMYVHKIELLKFTEFLPFLKLTSIFKNIVLVLFIYLCSPPKSQKGLLNYRRLVTVQEFNVTNSKILKTISIYKNTPNIKTSIFR